MSNAAVVIPQESVHTVPFHSHNLFVVEHDGHPFVPMKPVVEGMGLDWKTQHRKLNSNKDRWGMVKMTTPSNGGEQLAVSMPLRKLPGFICSIHPNKLRKELRPTVIMFQNECDDVLWDYWSKKVQSKPEQPKQIATTTLTPEQQHKAKKQVEKLARESELMPRIAFSRIWNDVKDHFQVATYKDILSSRFPELMRMLGAPVSDPLKEVAHNGHVLVGSVPVDAQSLKGTLSMAKELSPRRDTMFLAYEKVRRTEKAHHEAMEELDEAMYRIHDVLMDLPMHTRGLRLDR